MPGSTADERTPETYRGRYETKLPPIAIDRYLKTSLSEQVAERLRHAIQTGFYRPGDILPPLGALAARLGISLRVARDAMRRLACENLVMVRPRVGCSVLHPKAKCHHGRVLAVASVENMTSYYHAVLLLEVGRLMTAAGYFFESVPLFMAKSGRIDFAPLMDRLRGPVNLVMAYHPVSAVSRRLASLPVPYVAVGSVSKKRCTVYVHGDGARARRTFVEACARRGIRRVLVAVYGEHFALGDDLERAGISVERIKIPVKFGMMVGERLERDSMNAFIERLEDMRSRDALPDVVCAMDDFMVRGALAAFMHLGIRIPGDLEFVGAASDGAAPVMPCSMACFRHDPVAAAKTVAETLLGLLNGRKVPHDVLFEPEFVFGDTFPGQGSVRNGVAGKGL